MTNTPQPAADQDTSPLCPGHFPGATYYGEIVAGFYLGRLAQDTVADHRDTDLTGVAGRYGLFAEDGGCGALIGLFPGVPAPCPITAETDKRIDDVYEQCGPGETPALDPELAAAEQAYVAWLPPTREFELLLPPTLGHELVRAAQAAGYQSDEPGTTASFEGWLYDRAGRLLQA